MEKDLISSKEDSCVPDSYEKDLELVHSALVRRFRWIEAKLAMYSDGGDEDERKIEHLTNSLQRLSKSIVDCISIAKNPRLKLSQDDDESEKDLAKMLEQLRAKVKR
jgi:hypothetical protein